MALSLPTSDFIRFPFDWRTVIGYLIALLSQCAALLSILISFIPIICILIGSCWLSIVFVKDLINELAHLNTAKSKRNHPEIRAHFCQIVQSYADAKQLSGKK